MKSLKEAFEKSDDLTKGLWVSLGFHVFIFIVFGIKAAFFSPDIINYDAAVRVDIIGLPDKFTPDQLPPPPAKAESKPEEKPAPMPPPPKPPEPKVAEKPKVKEPEAVNLDKHKDKEKEALEKLKAMSALDEIKKDVEKDNHKKMAGVGNQKAAEVKIRGNVLSPGTELTGLNKLQHDSYLSSLDHQIKSHWFLPEWLAKKSFRAQVRLKIDDKGQILAREIALSSGNKSYDELALETIDKSAPFPPPPEKFVAIVSVNGLLIGFPE